MWCSIDLRGRERSSATLETGIGARISPAMPPARLCTHRQQTSTKGSIPYIHAFGDVAAHALAISSSASSGRPSQRAYRSRLSSSGRPGRGALLLSPPRSHPLTEAAKLTPNTNCRPRMYCNPSLDRQRRSRCPDSLAHTPSERSPPVSRVRAHFACLLG